jgi:hypothetical protein
VYSPTLFRSPHIALANSKDEALMKECALELSQLSSPTPDLAVLMQGLRPDARIWLTLAESIETRFGAPSEFWERIVRSFSEERGASDVFDMTNVDVLRMVATPLRWAACEIEALDRSSRIRLAEASIQCALGALRWQRGNGLVGNISLEFEVACSIAAAIWLKGGGDPVLLGSEVAPTGGRRGQTQSWRVHALYLFRVVIEEAQSRFSKHARAVRSAVIEAWTEAETRRGVAE